MTQVFSTIVSCRTVRTLTNYFLLMAVFCIYRNTGLYLIKKMMTSWRLQQAKRGLWTPSTTRTKKWSSSSLSYITACIHHSIGKHEVKKRVIVGELLIERTKSRQIGRGKGSFQLLNEGECIQRCSIKEHPFEHEQQETRPLLPRSWNLIHWTLLSHQEELAALYVRRRGRKPRKIFRR